MSTVPTAARDLVKEHTRLHKTTPTQQTTALAEFLTIRQIVPALALQQYLERSPNVVDVDRTLARLPKGLTAKDKTELMLEYLEITEILAAEGTPMQAFDVWVLAEAPIYLEEKAAGRTAPDVDPAPEIKPKTKNPRVKKEPVPIQWQAGMRASYRPPIGGTTGPPLEGHLEERLDDAELAHLVFIADTGEEIQFVEQQYLSPAAVETEPLQPVATEGGSQGAKEEPTPGGLPGQMALPLGDPPAVQAEAAPPPAEFHKLMIKKADAQKAAGFLGMATAVGNVPIGDVLYDFGCDFAIGRAQIQIVNGQPKPFVDAFFTQADGELLAELPAREHAVEGTYTFDIAGQQYTLEIASRG